MKPSIGIGLGLGAKTLLGHLHGLRKKGVQPEQHRNKRVPRAVAARCDADRRLWVQSGSRRMRNERAKLELWRRYRNKDEIGTDAIEPA